MLGAAKAKLTGSAAATAARVGTATDAAVAKGAAKVQASADSIAQETAKVQKAAASATQTAQRAASVASNPVVQHIAKNVAAEAKKDAEAAVNAKIAHGKASAQSTLDATRGTVQSAVKRLDGVAAATAVNPELRGALQKGSSKVVAASNKAGDTVQRAADAASQLTTPAGRAKAVAASTELAVDARAKLAGGAASVADSAVQAANTAAGTAANRAAGMTRQPSLRALTPQTILQRAASKLSDGSANDSNSPRRGLTGVVNKAVEKQKVELTQGLAEALQRPLRPGEIDKQVVKDPDDDRPDIPVFSPALEAVLGELVKSDDPLDGPRWDSVATINARFPDEQSLWGTQVVRRTSVSHAVAAGLIDGKETNTGEFQVETLTLDSFMAQTGRRLVIVQEEISKHLRQQRSKRTDVMEAVADSQRVVGELVQKVRGMKEKAEASERVVETIVKDIQGLDCAKKHMTTTMAAFRKLHMLINSVDELTRMCSDHVYKDIAQCFQTVNWLMEYFAPYVDTPMIRKLYQAVQANKDELHHVIMKEFRSFVPGVPPTSATPSRAAKPKPKSAGKPVKGKGQRSSEDLPADENGDNGAENSADGFGGGALRAREQRLNEACWVMEALGPEHKGELLSWFCTHQLDDYRSQYGPNKEGWAMSMANNRFQWLRFQLVEYEKDYANVFPKYWNVPALITREFCGLTKIHFQRMLGGNENKKNAPVPSMSDDQTKKVLELLRITVDFEREMASRFPTNAPAKPKDAEDKKPQKSKAVKASKDKEEKEIFDTDTSSIQFEGLISDVFISYLGGYEDLERNNMRQICDRLQANEAWNPTDPEPKAHFAGSDEIFMYLKKSVTNALRLNTGQLFFNITKQHQKGLLLYADLLESKLPDKDTTTNPDIALSIGQVKSACMILNTAEYCSETVSQLQDMVAKSIDAPFKDKIDFTPQQEAFNVLATKTAAQLVASTYNRVARVFAGLSKMPWSQWQTVGDTSDFVGSIYDILAKDYNIMGKLLSTVYHTYVCTQLAQKLAPAFEDAVFRCRRINVTGAQQLAIDAHALKQAMLELPTMGKPEDEKRQNQYRAYTRTVTKEFGRVEGIIKLLITPPERIISAFKSILPKESKSAESAELLLKIMDLLGLKKTEQQQLIEAYNQGCVTATDRVVASSSTGMNVSGMADAATDFMKDMKRLTLRGFQPRGITSE